MSHSRRFVMNSSAGPTGRSANSNKPIGDFWLDVSDRDSLDHLVSTNSENSQGRVLFEAFLILVVAGLMAVAASIWIPILQ